MKSREYYISLILSHAEELKSNFGVKSLRLFGSVSRNEQKEGSDVDICVDMEPKMFLVVRLKRFLENLLECSVDIVRDTVLFSKKKELRKINCRHFVFLYVLSLMGASRPLAPRCFQV